jgi:F-type H+-transporting ATPase subunit b
MTLRPRWMLGGILCAAVLLLAFSPARAAGAETPEAAHGAAQHESGGGLINVDASLIIQAANFLVLLLILHRLLYKPLLAKMEERTAAIKRALDEAQAARAEAARQQEENAARLRQALQEAASIREQALKEAADEQRRLVEAARLESQRLLESARAQMDGDVRRAREELRREVGDLATAVAEKLIRKSLRDDDHRRIIAEAMARLGN